MIGTGGRLVGPLYVHHDDDSGFVCERGFEFFNSLLGLCPALLPFARSVERGLLQREANIASISLGLYGQQSCSYRGALL